MRRGLVLIPLVLLSACSHNLAMDAVKSAISKGVTEKLGLQIATVTCPESREIKAGDSFECTADAQTGGQVKVLVTQTDANANIDWKVTNTENLIDLSTLEATVKKGLAEQASVDATVTCGAKYRVAQTGKTFDCGVKTADGKSATVKVTMTDDKGNVDWKIGQ